MARIARAFGRRFRASMLVLVALLASGNAIAAEPAIASPAHDEEKFAPAETDAPIVVWNRTLITLRAPFGRLTPAQRAAAAEQRIRAALETMRSDDIGSAWVQAGTDEGVLIRAGAQVLFGVLPADVDGTRAGAEAAGARVVEELKAIIAERTESLRLANFLKALATSAFALLVFAALCAAVARVHRRTHDRLEALAARRRSQGIDLRPIAWGAVRVLVDLLRLAAFLALAYLTMSLVLRQFPYTRPWGETLGRYVFDAAGRLGDAFVESIPALATLLLIWLITRGLVRVITAWFDAIEAGKIDSDWFDAQTAGATRRLVVTAIWLFALTVAYPYIPGSETAAFKGVSVFVGLMLSLGS
ncbi:MAG TPA: hypothetical protein VI258_14260, partial [Rhodanobacteraceae bacterium]